MLLRVGLSCIAETARLTCTLCVWRFPREPRTLPARQLLSGYQRKIPVFDDFDNYTGDVGNFCEDDNDDSKDDDDDSDGDDGG